MEEKYVTIDNLRVRYLEEGVGPSLVLLHGGSLGSSADIFRRNIASFVERGLHVVAFDQPGYGLSDVPKDHSTNFRRECIPKFIDTLRLGAVALVGHSNLGNVAVTLALQEPDRYSHIIVLGTGSLLPPLPEPSGIVPPPFLVERAKISAEPTIEQTRELMESYLYNKDLITPEEIERRHKYSVGRNFDAFIARKKLAASGAKPTKGVNWKRLAELKVPLLMIYGKDDRGGAEKRAAILKSQYPDMNLHLLDHCKHLLPWDAADDFVSLTASFVNGT